ncbi:hypothetical protein A33Q_1438 [Indibacter alkaliphilus LW1]|uniref:Uncharacterized protein n=1 Tax=Indibacter alkaliphilus (strain CCUG 57479 / KCTC 22604 / LW1) TaxID=1189612 RepID=S2DIC8_INDAL|nr:hypothetical protein A33Q_1438 [Indibacter alkaliphilus LW1]
MSIDKSGGRPFRDQKHPAWCFLLLRNEGASLKIAQTF